jgi:sulfur carrier protein ThiS
LIADLLKNENNPKLIVVIIDGFFLPDSQIAKEEKELSIM